MRLMGAPVSSLRTGGGQLCEGGLSCAMELRRYWRETPGGVGRTGTAVTAPLSGARAQLRRWEKQP